MGKLPIDLSSVTTVGLDLAKHVFFVRGIDEQGQVVLAREVRRRLIVKNDSNHVRFDSSAVICTVDDACRNPPA